MAVVMGSQMGLRSLEDTTLLKPSKQSLVIGLQLLIDVAWRHVPRRRETKRWGGMFFWQGRNDLFREARIANALTVACWIELHRGDSQINIKHHSSNIQLLSECHRMRDFDRLEISLEGTMQHCSTRESTTSNQS